MRIGFDIGSTTIKIAVLAEDGQLLFSKYQRHYSQIALNLLNLLEELRQRFPHLDRAKLAVSGSASLGIAERCQLQFVQEVFAEKIATEKLEPQTDVVIELGGEDAKILFLGRHFDACMNDSCAGGTGAFIDQMAALLNVETLAMNDLALAAQDTYTIASRCGVFAKSDIQPLLNQGAAKTDLSASIFQAVASQAVTGLAKGRPIKGNVLYLGGPLTFMSKLRDCFDEKLHVKGLCPENSLFYVAIGAALCAEQTADLLALPQLLRTASQVSSLAYAPPLFANQEEYAAFKERHSRATVPTAPLEQARKAYLGVDSGSTTIKMVLIDEDCRLLASFYQGNRGNPVVAVKNYLGQLYQEQPQLELLASAATGYGEDLIRHAFGLDYGIVETMAHFFAARHMQPEVDFILDIGGQDIKCLKIHNRAIDNIFLNEACSSGCGSFLQTFAGILGYKTQAFAQLGLFADKPVDLGSRCTVFMNSGVKQAQKDGISVNNISAGLSMSIIKNALYKVIRPSSKESIGRHIVVQGGTFLNDCVLRAFEREMGQQVTRPNIAGLMGAYGAALYAREKYLAAPKPTTTLDKEQLDHFFHKVLAVTCGLCSNHCHLTVNTFAGGRRFISGNRCERPITHCDPDDSFNLYRYKLSLLEGLRHQRQPEAPRGKIGLPLGLNMYELLPFWHSLLTELGFDVVVSPIENKNIYSDGQGTIPSDTVCYPAKLMHGHINWLLRQGLEYIFYPCMTYNISESGTDNCYNCPVVAYYPEVLKANIHQLGQVHCYFDYLSLNNRRVLAKHLAAMLEEDFPTIEAEDIQRALDRAYKAYYDFLAQVQAQGRQIMAQARAAGKPIIIMAGRPYQADPKVNHGIDRLLTTMGAAVVSEDAVAPLLSPEECFASLHVLNQWTYHSRLYAAAHYVTQHPDCQLVQFVNFGCGCDAITADECRRILEAQGRIYTQLKIDDIENLGAAKIRLRSLFSAANLPTAN